MSVFYDTTQGATITTFTIYCYHHYDISIHMIVLHEKTSWEHAFDSWTLVQ